MAGKFLYLDSSALVKLVRTEAESAALRELLKAWPLRVSSEFAKVEVVRAVRRATVALDSGEAILSQLARIGVPAINLREEEVDAEIEAARELAK